MRALAERRQLVVYQNPLELVAPYLTTTMHKRQKEAMAHAIDCLTGRRDPSCTACVLDLVMGIGKTLNALATLDTLFRAGGITHALVLCPPTLRTEWADQAARWLQPIGVVFVVLNTPPDISNYFSAHRAVLIAGYTSTLHLSACASAIRTPARG